MTKTMGEPGWYVPPSHHLSVQLSQRGQRLAAVDDATNVRVYDVETGSVLLGPITPLSVKEPSPDLLESAERVPSSRTLVGCLLSADGRRLAVAIDFGRGGAVYLHHIDTGRLLRIPSRYGYLACLNFSDDGRRLLIGSTDATVRTWDTETGLPIGPSLRHHTAVGLAAFSPEGRRIAVCDVDGMLSVWDCESGALLVPSFP
ncbi:MAG: WD40 repeat domain-containing protein, partial [Singulisphaera sp.]